MTRCRICGAECEVDSVRFWDPDDGWRFGTPCGGCRRAYGLGSCRPQEHDYAVGLFARDHRMNTIQALRFLLKEG